MAGPRRLLGQILKEGGLIHEGMVQEALQVQRDKGGLFGEVLVEMGCVQVQNWLPRHCQRPAALAVVLATACGLVACHGYAST